MGITNQRRINIWLLVCGAALFLLAITWPVDNSSADAIVSVAIDAPSDVQRLGLTLKDASGESASVDAAEAASKLDNTLVKRSEDVTAFLVRATDSTWVDNETPLNDRLIWLVRYAGLSLTIPGPADADGRPTTGHVAHYAYSLVDAKTGEVVDLQYWE